MTSRHNCTLISYTQDAKELLILTKETRRQAGFRHLSELRGLPEEEKDEALKHVFSTISGPLEFIEYVFLLENVTRAFTHQLVRSRIGTSFAQQTQRMPTVQEGFKFLASGKTLHNTRYHATMEAIDAAYHAMINEDGVDPQDARGILPTNIMTNIVVKINLRALNTMMNVRLCVRTQGEYQNVALDMRKEVLKVHPFVEKCLRPFCLEWGSCKFPRFTECPIKKVHPWLVPNEADLGEVSLVWERVVGKQSTQPK